MKENILDIQVLAELQAGALSEEGKHLLEMVVAKEVREILLSSPHLLSNMKIVVQEAQNAVVKELKKGIDEKAIAAEVARPFLDRLKTDERYGKSGIIRIAEEIIQREAASETRRALQETLSNIVHSTITPLIPQIQAEYMAKADQFVRLALEERVFYYKGLVEDLMKRVTALEMARRELGQTR